MDDATPFTIAAVPGVTLTKWTRAWQDRRADAPLEVIRTTEAEQVAVLRDGGADVCFVRLPIDDTGLSVIPLYVEAPVIVAPVGHPIEALESVALADLEGENLLGGSAEEAIALVAANVGVVLVPQSIARLHSRKDVVARPVTDATETRIALAWLSANTNERIEEFIGIVRGRTAHSSRATPTPPSAKPARAKPAKPAKPSKAQARTAANRRKQRGGR